jgi:hypothetical protein
LAPDRVGALPDVSPRPLYVAFIGVRMISRFGGKAVRP